MAFGRNQPTSLLPQVQKRISNVQPPGPATSQAKGAFDASLITRNRRPTETSAVSLVGAGQKRQLFGGGAG